MARLRKGDLVAVLSGKDRGKKGKLLQVWPERQVALVERVNLMKHFERRTRADQPGGIIERETPMALSKLALICPRCGKPTRVGMRLTADGGKQRTCKRCQEVIGSAKA